MFLAWPTLRSTLPFSIGIGDAAWQGNGAVVGEHVAVQGIERRVIDVGLEHSFAEVVEHHGAGGAA